MKTFDHNRFNTLIEMTVAEIHKLSELKGGEYAGDVDRLANFRRNAQGLGLDMETVWAVYAAKHWDAVMQYIRDIAANKTRTRLESIAGRADDLIVYMILFKAMVEERNDPVVPAAPENAGFSEREYTRANVMRPTLQESRCLACERPYKGTPSCSCGSPVFVV